MLPYRLALPPGARLSAILLALMLTSCAKTTASGVTSNAACILFQPISWSTEDTDETTRQVKGHNAVYVASCGDYLRQKQ